MPAPIARLWIDSRETPVALEEGSSWRIGRLPECEVVLDDSSVSRRHARITREGSTFYIEDLGSQWGVRLNDAFIANACALHEGDVLQVGRVTLRFELATADSREGARRAAGGAVREGEDAVAAAEQEPHPWQFSLGKTALEGPGERDRTIRLGDEASDRFTERKVRAVPRRFIHGPMTIGRSAECALVLADPTVSALHAELRPVRAVDAGAAPGGAEQAAAGSSAGATGDQGSSVGGALAVPPSRFVIRDLRSTNGTWVNDRRIEGEVALRAGDVVRIGPYVLEFDGQSIGGADAEQSVHIVATELGRRVVSRDTGRPLMILEGVNLVVAPSEFVGLLGESGSGKSTFLGALNGRRRATDGSVSYNRLDLYEHFDVYRSKIAYVPQDVIFHEPLTVSRAMEFAARLRLPPDTTGAETAAAIAEVLGILGLEERAQTRIADLSGGQKKRVAIGLELLSRPSVLFLDEATSGLDHATEVRMMQLFRRVADDGKTVVCITHSTDSLDACDLVAFFVRGRLAFYGSPAELKEYFDVRAIKDVYMRAGRRSPEEWASLYRSSAYFRKYVIARREAAPVSASVLSLPTRLLPGGVAQAGSRVPAGGAPLSARDTPSAAGPGRSRAPLGRAGSLRQAARQWVVLTRRYVEVLLGDRRHLLFLLMQAPIIALMIALIARDIAALPPDDAHPLLVTAVAAAAAQPRIVVFAMLVIAVIWCAGMASGREIVKERTIYLHERFVNLSPAAYIASKVPPLTAICLVQAASLTLVTFALVDMGADPWRAFLVLFVTAFAAMFIGLVLSCAVEKQDQVTALFPVILVAQVVFSGGLLPLAGATEYAAKGLIVAYWSMEGMKASLDEPMYGVIGGSEGYLLSLGIAALFALLYAALAYVLLLRLDRRLGLSAG